MARNVLRIAIVCAAALALCSYAVADEQPDYQYRDGDADIEKMLETSLDSNDLDSVSDVIGVGTVLESALRSARENGVQLDNATFSNKIAMFAENVASKVAVEYVEGDTVLINRERLKQTKEDGTSLEKNAVQSAVIQEGVLEFEETDTARQLRRVVTFSMEPDEELEKPPAITAVIDRDVLSSEVDVIRIETPKYALEIDVRNMQEDFDAAQDGQLVFSAHETYDESGHTKIQLQCPSLFSPVRLCLPVGRDSASGMTGRNDTAEAGDEGLLTGFYDSTAETMNCLVANSGLYYLDGYAPVFSDIGHLKREVRESIELLASQNILRGYSDGTFRPHNHVTRAQYIAMVMRTLGKDRDLHYKPDEPFDDVTPGKWYYYVVTNAQKMNLIKGFSKNTFGGDYKINAAQIYIVGGRILKYAYHYRPLDDYSEVLRQKFKGGYESYSTETQQWLAMSAEYGLVLEQSNKLFNGDINLERGNVAVVTKRVYKAGY